MSGDKIAAHYIPPKPTVDITEEGDSERFTRKGESLLEGRNSVRTPALAPCRPSQRPVGLRGNWTQFDGSPGLILCLFNMLTV